MVVYARVYRKNCPGVTHHENKASLGQLLNPPAWVGLNLKMTYSFSEKSALSSSLFFEGGGGCSCCLHDTLWNVPYDVQATSISSSFLP